MRQTTVKIDDRFAVSAVLVSAPAAQALAAGGESLSSVLAARGRPQPELIRRDMSAGRALRRSTAAGKGARHG